MVSALLTNIIGIIGAIGVLGAFILEDMGKIVRGGHTYNLVNLIGSAFLLTNALITRNLPFTLLNLAWVLISLFYLAKRKK